MDDEASKNDDIGESPDSKSDTPRRVRSSRIASVFGVVSIVFGVLALVCGYLNMGPLYFSPPKVEMVIGSIGLPSLLIAIIASPFGILISLYAIGEKENFRSGLRTVILAILGGTFALVGGGNLLASKMPDPNSGAIGRLRTMVTAQNQFVADCRVNVDGLESCDFGTLDQLVNPPGTNASPYIGGSMAYASNRIYTYSLEVTIGGQVRQSSFKYVAIPKNTEKYGYSFRSYYVDESGIVRVSDDGNPATAESPPLVQP